MSRSFERTTRVLTQVSTCQNPSTCRSERPECATDNWCTCQQQRQEHIYTRASIIPLTQQHNRSESNLCHRANVNLVKQTPTLDTQPLGTHDASLHTVHHNCRKERNTGVNLFKYCQPTPNQWCTVRRKLVRKRRVAWSKPNATAEWHGLAAGATSGECTEDRWERIVSWEATRWQCHGRHLVHLWKHLCRENARLTGKRWRHAIPVTRPMNKKPTTKQDATDALDW